ncbi:MAG: SDR family oxidoreductase, partial [Candidatus Saccharibacteria bacterium]
MNPPKVLIIGSKGTLGQEFLRVYADVSPIAWDREEIDITDKNAVENRLAELQPDIVINCAAYNAVDKAEQDPELADAINGYGPGNIAAACRKIGAVMVHYSTNYVFDGSREGGYNEEDEAKPLSKYGESKLLGEKAVMAASNLAYVIRTSMLYGLTGNGKKS